MWISLVHKRINSNQLTPGQANAETGEKRKEKIVDYVLEKSLYPCHPPEVGFQIPLVTEAKEGTLFRLVTHSPDRAYNGHDAG